MLKMTFAAISPIALSVLSFIGYRKYRQKKILRQTKLTGANAIDVPITFHVNGTELAGLIRGEDVANPLLLFVHGGPGLPDMPFARFFNNLIIKDYTVVHFDQRATGKSYNKSENIESLTIGMFINDVLGVARQLRQMYPGNKLFVMGHSCGAFMALQAVKSEPKLFDAYIGIGQVANLKESDVISYSFAFQRAREKQNHKAIKKLEAMDCRTYNLDADQLSKEREMLAETGGRYYDTSMKRTMLKGYIFSPEYTLKDLWNMEKTAKKIVQQIYPQIIPHNLFEEIGLVPIPFFLLGGRYDYQVPAVVAEAYFYHVKAPVKKFFWFEKSGHFPHYEEPNRFYDVLKEIKLQVMQPAQVASH